MKMPTKEVARGGDRLSELPESLLTHILSMLPESKQVVRTCVLSTRWRVLWMSVPVSLEFEFPNCGDDRLIRPVLASTNRELHYWRSCEKIRKFRVFHLWYYNHYVKDVDFWVLFATKLANVEEFRLEISNLSRHYQFPPFAYKIKNTSLRNLVLKGCQLNPSGSVNWTSLRSLSIKETSLEGTMEYILAGCPNLERLELNDVVGIHRLEITSTKLRELILHGYVDDDSVEVLAPYIQNLELSDFVRLRQCSVASLISAVLDLIFYLDEADEKDRDEKDREEDIGYLKELLRSLTHVQNLELSSGCIECLSILELRGWQCPPSSRKYLKLNSNFGQLHFPAICNFLKSSMDLEALVIDWDNEEETELLSLYTNKEEGNMRFEMDNFNFPLLHLKTIRIINVYGTPSMFKFILSLVKYFLKNATVLEKFVLVTSPNGIDVAQNFAKMEQELLSFPRSSPHASVVFSC